MKYFYSTPIPPDPPDTYGLRFSEEDQGQEIDRLMDEAEERERINNEKVS